MKKQEFINAVRTNSELNITNKLAGEVIESTFNEITNLIQGDNGKFSYPGFGTFALKSRNARTGINPKTRRRSRFSIQDGWFQAINGWKDVDQQPVIRLALQAVNADKKPGSPGSAFLFLQCRTQASLSGAPIVYFSKGPASAALLLLPPPVADSELKQSYAAMAFWYSPRFANATACSP